MGTMWLLRNCFSGVLCHSLRIGEWPQKSQSTRRWILNRKRALFYPCAGGDIETPFSAFNAIIDEFWFIDVNYNLRRLPQLRWSRTDGVETIKWNLNGSNYQVMTQRFKSPRFNKTISLNFVTGDGKTAFDILFADSRGERELSVFFHRGDSQGEGGSNVYWLHNSDFEGNHSGLLKHVLAKMEPPAILCTDGSNAISELRTHFDERNPPHDTHLTLPSVEVHGHTLAPIGTLDTRYGPTIVYKVMRTLIS